MSELTSEQEAFLKKLIELDSSGASVKKYLKNEVRGKDRQSYSLAYNLAKKGYIEAYFENDVLMNDMGGLSSEGRCYFIDKEAARNEAESLEKSRRKHNYKVACFSFFGGAISGGLVTFLLKFVFGI